MRVLCVGRHEFLSEHLCRYFGSLGAECFSATGAGQVLSSAGEVDPHMVVVDCDLLSPAVLDAWSEDPSMRDVPVLAVSLTRRPEEGAAPSLIGHSSVVYLPGLNHEQAGALLKGARRPRGVVAPDGPMLATAHPQSFAR